MKVLVSTGSPVSNNHHHEIHQIYYIQIPVADFQLMFTLNYTFKGIVHSKRKIMYSSS